MAAALVLIAAGILMAALFCLGVKFRIKYRYSALNALLGVLVFLTGSLSVVFVVAGLAKLIIPLTVYIIKAALPAPASNPLQKVLSWFLHY